MPDPRRYRSSWPSLSSNSPATTAVARSRTCDRSPRMRDPNLAQPRSLGTGNQGCERRQPVVSPRLPATAGCCAVPRRG
jgi:hypothetical protein